MNSRILTGMIPVVLFTVLVGREQLVAQNTRYKLIDLGTLGGPMSSQVSHALSVNNSGTVIAFAGLDIKDPYAPECLQDCFLSHAIKWEKGVSTDLGALPGVNDSLPLWISANGLIAGLSENGLIDLLTGFPQVAAILWRTNGSIVTLGGFGGNSSQTFSINSRGQAVGVALNTTHDQFAQFMNLLPAATQARAFLWQDGSIRDLGTLGGPDATAFVVNERGQVAGYSFTGSSPNATTGMPTAHPFLWEKGRMLDLGSLGGTLAVVGGLFEPGGVNLNNRGEVVGTSTLAGDKTWHPFLWADGVMKDLGTLGGRNGEAWFISDSGLVVGRADVSSKNTNHHAFLWKNGAMTDLGVLGPCLNSTAVSVNSKGQAVGDTGRCPGGGGGPPFLSEHGAAMVDLNTLVLPGSDLTLEAVAFINDRGEIAGNGILPNGDQHAVLLVPASAAEMAGAGALGVSKPAFALQDRKASTSVDSAFGNRNARPKLLHRLRPEP